MAKFLISIMLVISSLTIQANELVKIFDGNVINCKTKQDLINNAHTLLYHPKVISKGSNNGKIFIKVEATFLYCVENAQTEAELRRVFDVTTEVFGNSKAKVIHRNSEFTLRLIDEDNNIVDQARMIKDINGKFTFILEYPENHFSLPGLSKKMYDLDLVFMRQTEIWKGQQQMYNETGPEHFGGYRLKI